MTSEPRPRRRLRLLGCLLVPVFVLAAAGGVYLFRQHQSGRSFTEAIQQLGESSEDAATAAKVKTAFALSKSLSAYDIGVSVRGGAATLEGQLPSLEQKELAEALAADITGVESIDSRLTVDPAALPDPEVARLGARVAELELEATITDLFRERQDLDGSQVEVAVDGGQVWLSGRIPSYQQRYEVESLIRRMDGVTELESSLEVAEPDAPPATGDDAERVRQIQLALRDAEAFARPIRVEVADGQATLTGTVRNRAERALAEALARQVTGIASVANGLDIVPDDVAGGNDTGGDDEGDQAPRDPPAS